MINHEISHKFQLTLNKALNHWLYGSISGHSLRNRFYSSRLISAHHLQELAHFTNRPLIEDIVTVNKYAEVLAGFYEFWQSNIPHSSETLKMPESTVYAGWLDNGGRDERYAPVHLLKELLHKNGCEDFFLKGIVHGSVATLDDLPGFSDMDLAFVVKVSTLKNPGKLLGLRGLASEILTLTYAFDPFMHHGPYYLSEMDLSWYPEAIFPTVLFGYGVNLLDNLQEISVSTRPSDDVTARMMDMFEGFFSKWTANPFVLKDSYDLEWVLGSVMLLPALYLQGITGEFRYKRDTFAPSEKYFSHDEWEPVKIATYLRYNLTPRPKPSSNLVRLARLLRWPGLLQSVARNSKESVKRAQEAAKILGPDYPLRVLRLLRAMKEKLAETRAS